MPTAGTGSIARLHENPDALSITLDAAARSALDRLLQQHPVSGARYPRTTMARIDP